MMYQPFIKEIRRQQKTKEQIEVLVAFVGGCVSVLILGLLISLVSV